MIKREIGDRNGIANSLIGLGNAYYSLGDYAKAIDFYEQSLVITREIGDRNGIANSLIGLGNAYYSLGDYAKAIDFYEQSLVITTRDWRSQWHRSLSWQSGQCVLFTRRLCQSHRLPAAVPRDYTRDWRSQWHRNLSWNLGNAYCFTRRLCQSHRLPAAVP